MSDIRYYYSFRSPYAWLATLAVVKKGLDVDPVPLAKMPEGMDFPGVGVKPNKSKSSYFIKDIVRLSKRAGKKLTFPDPFELDWGKAHAPAHYAKGRGKALDYIAAAYEARWVRGENISEDEIIKKIAREVGLDPTDTVAAANDPAVQNAMMAELDATLETDQPFGVPYFIYQGEPFWGQDRIALLEERLAETRAHD